MRRRLIAVAAVFALGFVALGSGMAAACTGDCSGDGTVTVDELLQGVNIALEASPLSACPFFDRDADGAVTIDEVLTAVNNDISGCSAPIMRTVAGSGAEGFDGDGKDPLATAFYLPQDVTVGPDGLLYLVDWNNHRVRRIKDGKIETIAGTGMIGSAQDGNALYSEFNHPTNVFFDLQGGALISAWHNSEVKRLVLALDPSMGTLTNIAGTGARAFSGDGGPANSAALNLPSSTVVDSHGNIYISDQANQRIRVMDTNNIITTVCGSGTAGYSGDNGPATAAQLKGPAGQAAAPASRLAIDRNDRIYIADTGNHAVRMFDPSTGMIITVAGTGQPGYTGDDGPATQAQLNTPSDVAVASNGVLYIADTYNSVVRVVTTDGIIHTYAGTGDTDFGGDGGPANEAKLNQPYGIDVAPNGDVYIADTHNNRFRAAADTHVDIPPTPTPTPPPVIVPCTDQVGSICTYVGNGGTGYNGEGLNRLAVELYWPFDIEFTSTGRRIFLDWNNHKVREILADETVVTIVGTDFVGDGPADLSDTTPNGADPLTVNLNHPTDIQELSNGDILFNAWHNHKLRVIDHSTGRVHVVAGAGPGFKGDGGPAISALFNQPPHSTLDSSGNLFVIDQRNQRIRVIYNFDQQRGNGIIDTVVGTGVQGYNGDGLEATVNINLPAGPNPEPSGGLAFDANGKLYFSDTLNNLIRKVEFCSADFKCGVVTTIAGTGESSFAGDGGPSTAAVLDYPEDMEIGPDGNLYFADTNNNRVRMIDLTTGIIQTVAGTGDKGSDGDGGPALMAQLNRPFGIAFDHNGDLYVSDTFSSRIRKVKR